MSETEGVTMRAVEKDVLIDATPDVVWRVITDQDEVRNWFAPIVRVEPGEGGSYFLSWGPGMEGTARISVWEPNARLQIAEDHGDTQILVDYFLEAAAGGQTRLRLVHSGFSSDAKWDAYYEGTDAGWTYFMLHLKRHIERFLGSTRTMVMSRIPLSAAGDKAWPTVLKRAGLAALTVASPGDVVQVLIGPDTHEAAVEAVKAPRVLALRIPDLNDGLLLFEVEPGEKATNCGIYLSVYDLGDDRVAELRSGIDALAADLSN